MKVSMEIVIQEYRNQKKSIAGKLAGMPLGGQIMRSFWKIGRWEQQATKFKASYMKGEISTEVPFPTNRE